jgi:ribosome modulation factor
MIAQDKKAWDEGFQAGKDGQARQCPSPAVSAEAWSWHRGWREGEARRPKSDQPPFSALLSRRPRHP